MVINQGPVPERLISAIQDFVPFLDNFYLSMYCFEQHYAMADSGEEAGGPGPPLFLDHT